VLRAIIIVLAGLALLAKGADVFVAGGSGFAVRRGLSPAVIGLTIMAYGTSLPELVVSLSAAAEGNAAIALGNVLGSNIANIALILAICMLLRPEMIDTAIRPAIMRHALLMLAGTGIFALLAVRGVLDAPAGAVLLAAFAAIFLALWSGRGEGSGGRIEAHGWKDVAYIVLGLAAVVVGSRLVLDGAVELAETLGIPAFVIGMSMVAVGTSLPELATSLVAALSGEGGISIGNIIGSNIFNLLLILGAGAIIHPIAIGSAADVLAVCLFSVALLPLLIGSRIKVRVWSGILIVSYFLYLAWLFLAAPV